VAGRRRFFRTCRREFGFLESEHGCGRTEDEQWYAVQAIYRNETTFVAVTHDFRDLYTGVQLGPLLDGEVPPYPIFVQEESRLMWIDLCDVLAASGLPVPELSHASKHVERDLGVLAGELRERCGPLLTGDFSALDGAAAIVRARAERLRREDAD
jgi:hypothetical protein